MVRAQRLVGVVADETPGSLGGFMLWSGSATQYWGLQKKPQILALLLTFLIASGLAQLQGQDLKGWSFRWMQSSGLGAGVPLDENRQAVLLQVKQADLASQH